VPLFTRHPLALQTAYSEIKRRAQERTELLPGTPGSVGTRVVGGRQFYYRQFYDAVGKKRADYLGPVGLDAAEARAETVRASITLTKALVTEGRLLAQNGYVRVDARAGAILGSLANRGLFRAGAVLVGSHAYGALLNELAVRAAAFATEDVDVARDRPLDLALPDDVTFETILAESTVPLVPVPALDRKAPVTSYKVPGKDALRVDLLVPARGDEVTVRAVRELGANAQAVPGLRPLLARPVPAIVMGREGIIPVTVPRPEALAWHKLLLARTRAATSDKRGKDRAQAAVLLAVLAEDAEETVESGLDELPGSARRRAREACRPVVHTLRQAGHDRAADAVERAVAR
jgi:hypothetical protein